MAEKVGIHTKAQESKQKCSNFCNQKPKYSSLGSPADRILQLQKTAGNQATQRLIKSRALQAKLRVGQPNDIYEQEADQVAEQVMRMPDKVSVQQSPVNSQPERLSIQSATRYPDKDIQRKEDDDEEEGIVQMKQGSPLYAADSQPGAPPSVNEALSSPGLPLDPATSAFMEPRFGHDFSRVRVHSGSAAEQSARDVNANAYTAGHNIVFGAGRFEPGTQEGRRLIAHELTHVVQQSLSKENGVSQSDDKRGRLPISSISTIGIAIQRDTPKQSAMEKKEERFPWVGRIHRTYSAALRSRPHKNPNDPHAGTVADLAKGTVVNVFERRGGWLHVRASVGGKEVEGYVSEELVKFIRLDIDPASEPIPSRFSPTGFTDEDIYKEDETKGPQATYYLAPSQIQISGSKELKKGRMVWLLMPPREESSTKGSSMASMKIEFTPKSTYRSQTVTFLQTVKTLTSKAKVDLQQNVEEVDPFYGANWDPNINAWISEPGFGNPSSSTEATARLSDSPMLFPGMTKIYETVAVIPETGEVLGSLRWGFTKDKVLGARSNDCTDLPSDEFGSAISNFYSKDLGSGGLGHFDAIVDGYGAEDFYLSTGNQEKLDPIITEFLNLLKKVTSDMRIAVSGFADASEEDPNYTSYMRAIFVQRYLMSKGVPYERIDVHSFGASWARFPSVPSESRNRRVQIRQYFK